ncbi:FxsA family protein [Corynebacterium sp. ES2794-CONJ1]|uniref:FxsA family protein n=1 Tax=unclassified Corynebacterium TaxID=2624378 RepID=UPI002167D70E|nr:MULTISPECIES: FxsA family protein [unclassified Corynebacterium]MCS4489358.1 FxsA family protein [Corynebacterium sp. ES2775-CONJ]MCS4491171.1 FxsA family protein [Corynebacterium sp. ES2715-CONJ3]MCS4530948.1 FxsA family protein [Corynebacterium sp. ES2730-CONJ]MCU9518315.1 FxsA family protein [Corynebacterium sp. ES2794-CONJ1]
MPYFLVVPYFVCEALAFWLVSKWLGVGVALLLLFAFFFAGLLLAAIEMRRVARSASLGSSAGQAVGDLGLLAAGAVGVALPGFVTTLIGLILIIAPTRAVVRRLLAKKLRAKIADLGVRSFEMTQGYRSPHSYGHFGPGAQSRASGSSVTPTAETIDEEELSTWSKNLNPEDFDDPKKSS